MWLRMLGYLGAGFAISGVIALARAKGDIETLWIGVGFVVIGVAMEIIAFIKMAEKEKK